LEAKLKKDHDAGKKITGKGSTAKAMAKSTSSSSSSGGATAQADQNTREKSDKNIEKFNRLVVYDKDEEQKSKYQSEVRGRVQDRNVKIDIEPMFVLTYYEKADVVKKSVYYSKMVEDYNANTKLNYNLLITNQEVALTEEQISLHFNSINEYSAKIDRDSTNANVYFGRAIDFMLVQNFSESIEDYTKAISLNPNFAMAYFNRAVVRYKQLEYNTAQAADSQEDLSVINVSTYKSGKKQSQENADATSAQVTENKRAHEHELISRDYDMVIRLNPEFVYAYFNRGNLRCAQHDYSAAIQDYNDAIQRDPDFAEAYFNRGLARLSQGDVANGVADLSKSGELGIVDAYSIIKRMLKNE